MTYWLDSFTGKTWQEFRDAGADVSGFSKKREKIAKQIQPGDLLLCYLTGVQIWVGILEVKGSSSDTRSIWSYEQFPVRFQVDPLMQLDPEQGLPMSALEGKVSFFDNPKKKGKYDGVVRGSPTRLKPDDGKRIAELLEQRKDSGILQVIDPKKLAYTPAFVVNRKVGKTLEPTVVSVPEKEEVETLKLETPEQKTRHTEIQWTLGKLGHDLGYDIWIASNDRTKIWKGTTLGSLEGLVNELPTQFNDATTRTIELIDVLWLKGHSIVAAFEIECTTQVYSGLLRMSDLIALQPNLNIDLYIVAPDERRNKVEQEIIRPTFALRDRPLGAVCGFLAFSKLVEKVDAAYQHGFIDSLKPEFLNKLAEFYSDK